MSDDGQMLVTEILLLFSSIREKSSDDAWNPYFNKVHGFKKKGNFVLFELSINMLKCQVPALT